MASAPSLNRQADYLMAIWLLTHPLGERPPGRRGAQPTAPARVAEQLGVSRATVGEMLAKLEERGLVERGERKQALLTRQGRAEAMRALRKHRLLERFLTDMLGYEAWQVADHIAHLGEAFDGGLIERLYERLGEPERCPHGFPIDPDHELRENPTLCTLDNLARGGAGEVVRIAEREPGVQQAITSAGLVPGARVELDGEGELRVAGAAVELDPAARALVFVRRDGVPAVPAHARCWADILSASRRRQAE